MRAALVIARRILRQRLRDRSAILFAVLTPLGLAVAFAAVIPDFSPTFHTTILVVDQDGGAVADAFRNEVVPGIVRTGIADVVPVADEAAAASEIEADRAGVAIVIPAGLSEAVSAGKPAELRILAGGNVTAREVGRAVASSFAADIGTVQLAVRTISAGGGQIDQATIDGAMAAVHGTPPIAIAELAAGARQASLATFYGAAMAIMFVFFATQYGALALLGERRDGTLEPAARGAGLAGGDRARWVARRDGPRARGDDDPRPRDDRARPCQLGSAGRCSPCCCSRPSSLRPGSPRWSRRWPGRSSRRVGSTRSWPCRMAAVGGVFIPLSQAPELLGRIALITPHAWFLRAIDTMSVAERRPGRDPAIGRGARRDGPRHRRDRPRPRATLADAGMKALEIARVNMVRTFRDRMSLFFILVLPMILIVVLGHDLRRHERGPGRRRRRGRRPARGRPGRRR